MKIAYGYSVTDENDHFVWLAEESARVASLAGAPGKWLVDSIPLCMSTCSIVFLTHDLSQWLSFPNGSQAQNLRSRLVNGPTSSILNHLSPISGLKSES
jgi:hypothetical protein